MMTKEKERTFMCSDISRRNFLFFEEMQKKKELCDITFQLQEGSFSAHRIIIAAVIPYFRVMLANTCPQKNEDIVLPDVEPNAFKRLLEFAYSCEVKIDTENVRDLLSAAFYLGVNEVQEACCDFIADTLEPENVLSVRLFAEGLNCSELLESTHCYMKENFIAISQTKGFLKLSPSYLKELITEDDLNVCSEKEALSAVMKWANEFPEDRSSALPELLLNIRMPLIEPMYLANIVKTEKLIQASVLCRDLIDEAKNYNLFPQLRNTVCSFQTQQRESVSSISFTEEVGEKNRCIYLLNHGVKTSVRRWDPLQEKWLPEGRKEFYTNDGLSAEVQNKIYFFDTRRLLEYDSSNKTYRYRAPIPTSRSYAGGTSFRNKIYVCGGKVGMSASNAVECFDPEQDKWEIVSSMPTACWGLCAVVLEKRIYMLGGADEHSGYDHMQRYDPVKKKWKAMPPMLNKRCYAGAAVLNGKIYICGGCTTEWAATAEVYDSLKNVWGCIAPMHGSCYDVSLLSYRGKLHVVGLRMAEGKGVEVYEIYDPEKDEWSSSLTPDPTFRVSGAVVTKLPIKNQSDG